jgi:hypothetical protein
VAGFSLEASNLKRPAMTRPFDILYSDLQRALQQGDRRDPGPDRYLEGIGLIRECVGKLRALGLKFMKDEVKEIEYFREVWPAFIGEEEGRVSAYFRNNRKFWQYYRSRAPAIDGQFTRVYDRGRIFEPLAMVMDPEATTLASYRAAGCLAMYEYSEWLREERADLSVGKVSAADLGYGWAATDADLAEWLFGIQAVGAIQYQGQSADISRLQKWARLALGKEVANIYDRARVLRNRKKEKLAFSKKMAAALEKKWNEADGKFE